MKELNNNELQLVNGGDQGEGANLLGYLVVKSYAVGVLSLLVDYAYWQD